MKSEELLELITEEDVIEIMNDLGCSYQKNETDYIIFDTICHGGNSKKLWFYKDSKIFSCFTCCGTMSIYDLVMNVKGICFKDAYNYIAKFKGVSTHDNKPKGIIKREKENTDLRFLRLHTKKIEKRKIKLPFYSERVLSVFDNYMPLSWNDEGISEQVAELFEIKIYFNQQKAIIPHRDIYGNLVGIRSRNFNYQQVEKGMKYMPIKIEGLTYKYPMNFNLYGLYQNKENIRRLKKVIIFESEKSVMLYSTIYGQENNISVATCGMTFSLYQRDLLLSLGVEEIIIAYDKQYELDKLDYFENNSKLNKDELIIYKKKKEEYNGYFKRLIKIAKTTMDYCNISVISCWDDRIDYKDSPIDKGKKIFEEFYKERFLITNINELEELLIYEI
ncbi:hypothetical protein DVV91_10010 [Clostridium botulinum]|uniref:hypothetical protein n=1 Tax=Clostridium TaxID=1485 RepID=UPI0019673F8B|nr:MULTISPECIES: hypothetical protein [Clostridium]MBN1074675.1 hypothetical protein [Clostridium botulinum]